MNGNAPLFLKVYSLTSSSSAVANQLLAYTFALMLHKKYMIEHRKNVRVSSKPWRTLILIACSAFWRCVSRKNLLTNAFICLDFALMTLLFF
jgi:hypothetical protein